MRTKIAIAILIIIGILGFLHFKNIYDEKNAERPPIFEIPNTSRDFNNEMISTWEVHRYYIIQTPPDNLDALKKVIDAFIKDNEIIKELQNSISNNGITYKINLMFYRKSEFTPVYWEPYLYEFDDDVSGHASDHIASVSFYSDKNDLHYNLMKLTKNDNGSCRIVENVYYIGDKVVEGFD